MKRIVILLLCFLMGMGILMYGFPFKQGVDAKTPERKFAQEVLKSDWDGKWKCNLNGQIVEAEFEYQSTTNKVHGNISDSGGKSKTFGERDLDKSDLPSSRLDHMLPLLYDGNKTDKWMLMMHTGDRSYASGYASLERIPFGLQCHKESVGVERRIRERRNPEPRIRRK
jgi:hypothetical protein